MMEMTINDLKNNKFFDKLLIVRGESNLRYMADQLRECLESENVILNREQILQILDIFIRGIFSEHRFNDKKELYPIFIMIGHIKINIESIDHEGIKQYIEEINSIKHIFNDDMLKRITDNIGIITKEFSIFINELFITLAQMFESINSNNNVRCFSGLLRLNNNKRFSIIYTVPPKGLNQMAYIIQSNIISDQINQEALSVIEKSFNEDDDFKKYIEKITKNQTL